jgi:BirA family biotin operon repressor/biotin-[acetyl-CoA-carboxylase] ligase
LELSVVDDLDSVRLRDRITGDWGRTLTVLRSTASTMDDASKVARAGATDGHVVVADRQTQGRGAHGREWVSPAGTDLYFSIVTRPEVDPSSMALVTLATGLGVRDAVATLLPGRSVTVKWPNDIWVDRRKCAGILVESRMVGTRIEAVIIGVGLNVNRSEWPPELEGFATSLRAERDSGVPLNRAEVLGVLLFHIERWVKRFIKDGARVLIDALRPNLALVGEKVRWEDGQGVFQGIDERGAARVRTDAGIATLHAARIEPLFVRP